MGKRKPAVPGGTTTRRVPQPRERHVMLLVQVVLTVLVAYGVLAIIGQTSDTRTLSVPGVVVHLYYDSSLTEQLVWMAVCVVTVVIMRWLLPIGPRLTWRQRRRDIKAYREIERALDTIADGRVRFRPDRSVGFLSTGTHWRPRVLRYTFDKDTLPKVDEVGELLGEVLTLSPVPPKVSRYAEIVPTVLTDNGDLWFDKELLARMTPTPTTHRQWYASLRLSMATGLAWLDSDELHELAAQIRSATIVVNP